MQNNSLLTVDHVNKGFRVKKGILHAVNDVSFTLEKGELLGIVGESGCGKSTLAKILAGILPADQGQIRLNGIDYLHLKGREKRMFRRNVQVVFQEPLSSFSPRMKIGTYLCEPRINYDHISKQEALKEAVELLEKVGLSAEYAYRYPHELSGGQLQRVAIARAIAIHPSLLICDEATGALDVSIQQQIAQLLVRLVEEEEIGCLFIGHDLAFVRSVSQRIAVMYLGRIVEVINSESLEQESIHPYTRALLDSIFDVYCDPKKSIRLLQGEPPSPLQEQNGCVFAARCPKCQQRCLKELPVLRSLNCEHYVACHEV